MPDFDIDSSKAVDHPVLVTKVRGRFACSCEAYESIVLAARKPDDKGVLGELGEEEEPCFHLILLGMLRREELGKY